MDPSVGRFTSMDTYQGRNNEPITLYKYLYANVDPVNGVDPSGNVTLTEVSNVQVASSYIIRGLFTSSRLILGKTPRSIGIPKSLIGNATAGSLKKLIKKFISIRPTKGQFVWRVHGGGAAKDGRSWTPLPPPLATQIGLNFRNVAGLPKINAGNKLTLGILNKVRGIIVRPALPLFGNTGGWPEYFFRSSPPLKRGAIIPIGTFAVNPRY